MSTAVSDADAAAPAASAVLQVLQVQDIVTRFGRQTVHDGVSFSVGRGELVALIGGSGSGKSVLLRAMIGLQPPTRAASNCWAPICGPPQRLNATPCGGASA